MISGKSRADGGFCLGGCVVLVAVIVLIVGAGALGGIVHLSWRLPNDIAAAPLL